MGAPLAQQLLASAVVHGTDSIMDNAYEAQQRETLHHKSLANSDPDAYWSSFVTAGFERISPITEPLPAEQTTALSVMNSQATETEPATSENSMARAAPLVRVEIWNMLIGEEKQSVLERAYALGHTELPPKRDWGQVDVATGAIADGGQQSVTFLVPPQLGKLRSGQLAIVELDQAGNLSIARYSTH